MGVCVTDSMTGMVFRCIRCFLCVSLLLTYLRHIHYSSTISGSGHIWNWKDEIWCNLSIKWPCKQLQRSTDLDVSTGMDLVHGVTRSSAGLAIKIVAHDKHAVIAQTTQPHISLTAHVQHDALANVQPAQCTNPTRSQKLNKEEAIPSPFPLSH